MPPFNPVPRAVARLVTRSKILSSYNQIRSSRSIVGTNVFSSADKLAVEGYGNRIFPEYGNSFNISNAVSQKRRFLGCIDDGQGNTVSKVHEERLVLGYSPEQLFNVVAAVDMYEDFLPWCQRSQIIYRNPNGSFDAELEIGFKFLVESYTSHVELDRPKSIKTASSQTSLFDHLINYWEFTPGPVPGSCNVYFLVDFKFKSQFYRQIANMFFQEVVSKLVSSFSDRCLFIYGPGVPVLQNTHEQSSRQS